MHSLCVHAYHECLTRFLVGLVKLSVNIVSFGLLVMGWEENISKMYKSELLSLV